MLVASVFGHLLLMTFVLFLPKPTTFEKIVPPAFMVELVEISAGQKKTAPKPLKNKKAPKKPVPIPVEKAKPAPQKKVKAVTPIKPVAEPKPFEPIQPSIKMPPEPRTQKVKSNTSDQILNTLDQLNNPPEKMGRELDQLAKLVPRVSIQQPVIKKSKPIQETTFDETNSLSTKKIAPTPSNIEPLETEDPLDFDKLKMQENLEVETPPNELKEEKTPDSGLKNLEFASLSKTDLKLEKKQDEKSSADLLKELEEMKQPTLPNEERTVAPSQEINAPVNTQEPTQAYDSILKKLESLNTKPNEFDTKIARPETLAQNYQSDIRKVSVPKRVRVDVVVSPNQAYVKSPNQGKPSADILSQYVGMIHERVFGNWREPLGGKFNKEVIYTFDIYPKGNIDRLDLKKSSQVDLLDSLALRAIHESKPFPEFPKSLDYQNLNISIHFKYIPEKNKT